MSEFVNTPKSELNEDQIRQLEEVNCFVLFLNFIFTDVYIYVSMKLVKVLYQYYNNQSKITHKF